MIQFFAYAEAHSSQHTEHVMITMICAGARHFNILACIHPSVVREVYAIIILLLFCQIHSCRQVSLFIYIYIIYIYFSISVPLSCFFIFRVSFLCVQHYFRIFTNTYTRPNANHIVSLKYMHTLTHIATLSSPSVVFRPLQTTER